MLIHHVIRKNSHYLEIILDNGVLMEGYVAEMWEDCYIRTNPYIVNGKVVKARSFIASVTRDNSDPPKSVSAWIREVIDVDPEMIC